MSLEILGFYSCHKLGFQFVTTHSKDTDMGPVWVLLELAPGFFVAHILRAFPSFFLSCPLWVSLLGPKFQFSLFDPYF